MYINKVFIKQLLALVLLGLSCNVFAETRPFRVIETMSLQIKLSNDGTGIVKGIHCNGCDFKYVRITPKSKASVQGVEVDILEAKSRLGKSAMVSFNPETLEVQYIRW